MSRAGVRYRHWQGHLVRALPELQREFARAMLRPDAGVAAIGALAGGHMEIYANGYKTRLADALKANFPTLHRVLGDDAFDELAHRYIDKTPSSYRSIRWLGRELEAFARRDASALPHAALLDLLRMDWAIGAAFDAADVPPLRAAQLHVVAPEQWAGLGLMLHPSVTLLRLAWAVEPIWRTASRELDETGASHESEAPAQSPHHLLIWRDGLEARWRVPVDEEARALGQIGSGCNFGELCNYLVARSGETDAAQTAATYLAGWVADSLLANTLAAAETETDAAIETNMGPPAC